MDDELALYNKTGDLYVKMHNVNAAVEMYERAVNRYTESGFPNNAIALCNKILRSAPGRNNVYLKLAQLMVQRGFVAEAKKNFVEYAERMSAAGKLDEAFAALKRFADISPENEEIRLMLAEQLKHSARDDEAREQIEKLMQASGAGPGTPGALDKKIRAVDPEYDVDNASSHPKPAARNLGKTDLIFISLDDDEDAAAEPLPEPVLAAEPDPVVEPEVVVEPKLEFLVEPDAVHDAGEDVIEIEPLVAGLDGFETASLDLEAGGEMESLGLDTPVIDIGDGLPALEIEAPSLEEFEFEAPAGPPPVPLEIPELAVGPLDELELEDDAVVDMPPLELDEEDLDIPAVEAVAEFSFDDVVAPAGLPVIEDLALGVADLEIAAPSISDLENRIATQPDNPLHHRQLAEALFESGDRARGLEELNLTLELFQGREEWGHASSLIDEMLRLDPSHVGYHQKRVEIAYKGGDRGELIAAYLDLANALFKDGDLEKAEAIYRRVVEHDPGNRSAENALAALVPLAPEPPPPPPPPVAAPAAPVAAPAVPAAAPPRPPAPVAESQYVDLGDFIMGEDDLAIKDTRMKIEEDAPTGDEQADFNQMLQQFKRGIDENIDETDGQAHYDLGVAFKEMGLVDEAIGEFQKSLRTPETRLGSAEMLGHCFMEKGQIEVASTVLRRAVEADPSADQGKIGLLYWLARCEEDNQRPKEALKYYQRCFAVDVNFQDVGARVDALVKAGG